ncbi:hypothetical protein Tco_0990439 [Tanacetum coccineum]|uniref:Uncharacterized protein n=1 Tax=Tanacetum coccineum TaxID=301880 RepID=A0ABQ5EWR1_9ASTR
MENLIQDKSALEERLNKHGSYLYNLENLNIPQKVRKVVDEIVTDAVEWALQAPLHARFRDLPKADMKEILLQRIWETGSYKTHEDHKNLYEALEKSMDHDYSDQLQADLAEAHKKRQKISDSPRTPSGSPPPPPPPLPPSLGSSSSPGAYRASGSSQLPLPPPSSSSKLLGQSHTPETNLQDPLDDNLGTVLKNLSHKYWWKTRDDDERPATPEPAWVIPTSYIPDAVNNWANALASMYQAPAENSLLEKTGDMRMFMNWYCQKMEECHKMLTDKIDWANPEGDQVRIDISRPLPLSGPPGKDFKNLYPNDFEDLNLLLLQGHLNHLPSSDKCMLSTAVNLWTRNLDAKGFEYKHDYTIIESPRSVVFPVRNNERKIMRFNEIYKFSDGTLTNILEALDYRVNEHKVQVNREMEIPHSSGVHFIIACSYSTDTSNDLMKAQMSQAQDGERPQIDDQRLDLADDLKEAQDHISRLVTADEKTQKKNDVNARSMLLMALPNEHLLTFNQYKDAKTLFAAIQTRFGGNDATKKTQKTLLKQIQLAILGENISQEDLNLKFLRSLPSEWNTHVVVWRNKPDLDTMSFDDLYNNFKIVEQEVKGTASSSSSSQNLAFMSSTSSTNEVNTAYGVSTANLSDDTVYAFLASQPNRSHLIHEDLEQIYEDDLEEMDLKWQLALLSMRARKFF